MKILQKTFEANVIIFKQGDLGTEMFVVASGEVETRVKHSLLNITLIR